MQIVCHQCYNVISLIDTVEDLSCLQPICRECAPPEAPWFWGLVDDDDDDEVWAPYDPWEPDFDWEEEENTCCVSSESDWDETLE